MSYTQKPHDCLDTDNAHYRILHRTGPMVYSITQKLTVLEIRQCLDCGFIGDKRV